jgi:hypothetical protein
MKEDNRREERIAVSEEISCNLGKIMDLSPRGIFIASRMNGFSTNDPIKLTIRKDNRSAIKIQARIRRLAQDGFGAEIDKSATNIADLDKFHLLVKKCKRI